MNLDNTLRFSETLSDYLEALGFTYDKVHVTFNEVTKFGRIIYTGCPSYAPASDVQKFFVAYGMERSRGKNKDYCYTMRIVGDVTPAQKHISSLYSDLRTAQFKASALGTKETRLLRRYDVALNDYRKLFAAELAKATKSFDAFEAAIAEHGDDSGDYEKWSDEIRDLAEIVADSLVPFMYTYATATGLDDRPSRDLMLDVMALRYGGGHCDGTYYMDTLIGMAKRKLHDFKEVESGIRQVKETTLRTILKHNEAQLAKTAPKLLAKLKAFKLQ